MFGKRLADVSLWHHHNGIISEKEKSVTIKPILLLIRLMEQYDKDLTFPKHRQEIHGRICSTALCGPQLRIKKSNSLAFEECTK